MTDPLMLNPADPANVPVLPGEHLVDDATRAVAWAAQRPWLAAIPVVLAAATVAARAWWWRRRQDRLAGHAHHVTITPPALVEPAGAVAWWANLSELLAPSRLRRVLRGAPHVAVEYRWAGRQLTIGVWAPGAVPAGPIAAAARAAWPGAATTVTDPAPPVPLDALPPAACSPRRCRPGTRCRPATTRTRRGPWSPRRPACTAASTPACRSWPGRPPHGRPPGCAAASPGCAPGAPAAGVLDPTTWLRGLLDLVTELVTAPLTPRMTAHRHTGARTRPVPADPVRDHDARAAVEKAIDSCWEVAIRYAVADTNPRGLPAEALRPRLTVLAHATASAFGAYTARNRLRRRRLRRPARVLAGRRLRRGCLLSARELATIAALPLDVAVPGLDRARARSAPAPVTVPAGGRGAKPLGRAAAGGHAVALPVVDARHHLHVLGSTGSGKSTAMTHMILADIRAHRGVIVIDPKGDLALDVIDRLPASLADRIVITDPDQPRGATLNPLAGADDDLVVDNIVSIFAKIFTRHWGPASTTCCGWRA